MAKYLTNKETQVALDNIILNAEKKLILVSPYISLTNYLFTRIKSAAEKGVAVKVIYRKGSVKDKEIEKLNSIENIELKSTEDLHAKCYFNEKDMLITSLNLLDTSEKNWEMGIHINRTDDKDIFDTAVRDVQAIFINSDPLLAKRIKINREEFTPKVLKTNNGYCIRCSEEIVFNVERPLCRSCYSKWNEWGNSDYPEAFCHFTGEKSYQETSMDYPILKKNWNKAKEIYKLK